MDGQIIFHPGENTSDLNQHNLCLQLVFFLILIMNDKSPRNSSEGLSAFSHGKTSFDKCRSETRHQVWIRFSDDKCAHTPCVFMGGRNSCLCLSSVWTQKGMLESLPAVTGTEEGVHDGRDTHSDSESPVTRS